MGTNPLPIASLYVLWPCNSATDKIIKDLNDELKKKGKIVIAGRISRKYFEERLY